MARTAAVLSSGPRIADYISLGVIANSFPPEAIRSALEKTDKASVRQRDLPANVVIYYVISLALYMRASYREVLRCLLEGVQWLLDPRVPLKVAGKSGISQARSRLGWEPLKELHDELVRPIAVPRTKGAWYREWRLVSLDGSTLDVADERGNNKEFGRPASTGGRSAFPQIRFVSLVENGTHVLFGSKMGPYTTGEITLAKSVIPHLQKGMLCLADRNFFGFALWRLASVNHADLLWRIRKNLRLECERRFPDGSFLSRIYASEKDRRHKAKGVAVRVIEYQLAGVADAEPIYRLLTTILDPDKAPAKELAALYHERWQIEVALSELKTQLLDSRIVLRSKTPDLVRQEFYGLLLAHFAIRGLMHEAALKASRDPDRLSFVHAVHVVRRKLKSYATIPPSGQEGLSLRGPR